MRVRNSRTISVRGKVIFLLASLTALWGFAAWVTGAEGVNMLGVATLDAGIAQPQEKLLVNLQTERRMTMVALGDPISARRQHASLTSQRQATDTTLVDFRALATGGFVRWIADDALDERVAQALHALDGLAGIRADVDAGRGDRERVAAAYDTVIDQQYRIYDSMAQLDDPGVAKDTRTAILMARAREVLAREDSLAAGVLAAGKMTTVERARFAQLVGTQRYLFGNALAELPAADAASFQRLQDTPQAADLRNMEEQLMNPPGSAQAALPVSLVHWNTIATDVLQRLQQVVLTTGDGITDRAVPIAVGVVVRLLAAAGLGLVAVIAAIVFTITTARRILGQLDKLRTEARELAENRLPAVVTRVSRGEEVDLATEAPPLDFGADQIGQVGEAVNEVQRTALSLAAGQAQLRRDNATVLSNLARRFLVLVQQQLSQLYAMQRRGDIEPAELDNLFKIDHVATRMRRHAENLLVMAGSRPGRGWREPIAMLDVVRGALAEVEDYQRAQVSVLAPAWVEGHVVSDVIHLFAELVENALRFSPPVTTVTIVGELVAHGYAVEIEDRGLGMSREALDEANHKLANPEQATLSTHPLLGLYVVGQLAERHGIGVTLKQSPYGGLSAVVLIPRELVHLTASGVGDLETQTWADRLGASAPPIGAPVRQLSSPRHSTGPRPLAGPQPLVGAQPYADPQPFTEAQPYADPRAGAQPEPVIEHMIGSVAAFSTGPLARLTVHPGHPGPSRADQPAKDAGPAGTTLNGLPRRSPQTHLAAPLRTSSASSPPQPDTGKPGASPEEIAATLASYQRGTEAGRERAARQIDERSDPPPGPSA
ncbi:nitrate- and nitrite sensing domain-containing protein [Streptosporangiaceae bacterium NEAU-GS5]|nr:nitrate- and nitrite sensing domain-containing protein [Streptosporangiaceae bacterium NEAU-GS5]